MDERLSRLDESHVMPLTMLIRKWRERGLEIPDVDPNDGGVGARALFLFETPGPRAVGTGFISRENPDPSAQNLSRVMERAGIHREETVLWNVVPYCVSTRERNQNATTGQIIAAAPLTQEFVDNLPKLELAVFCGRQPQKALPYLKFRSGVRTLKTFHPGAQSYNHARCRENIHATFEEARCQLG